MIYSLLPFNFHQLNHASISLAIAQLNHNSPLSVHECSMQASRGLWLSMGTIFFDFTSHTSIFDSLNFQKQIQSAMLCWLLLAYRDIHSALDFIGPPTFSSFRVIPRTSVKQAMNLLVLGGKNSVCRPFSMATDKY